MPRFQQRTLLLTLAVILFLGVGLWVGSGTSGPGEDRNQDLATTDSIPGESVSLAKAGQEEESDIESTRLALTATDNKDLATASLCIELSYANGEPGADLLLVIAPENLVRDAPSKRRIVKRSDAEGIVTCHELAQGQYEVLVLHPTRLEREIQVIGGEETICTIQFEAGMLLTGEVLDRQGKAIADASIWTSDSIGIGPIAMSDSNGRFSLPAVQRYVTVGATAPFYAPSQMQRVPWKSGGKGHVQLVLEGRGGSVQGRVLSSQGNPVRDAQVIFPNTDLPWTFLNDGKSKQVIEVQVRTDAMGRFLANGLPPLTLPIEVKAEGHGAIAKSVEVYAGGTTEITLRMTGTGSIHGRVLSQEGKGLDSVLVIASSNQWGSMAKTRSDARGEFILADLSLGELYVQAYEGEDRSGWEELTLSAGDVRELDLVLMTGAELSGKLIDHQGKALSGWLISAIPYRISGTLAFAETKTDGGFLLEHLEPGSLHTLSLMVPVGGWPPNHILHGVRAGTRDLLIRVPAEALLRGSIRGRVLDANGKPFENPRVAMMHLDSENPMMAEFVADGGFHSDSLPTGRYLVSINLGPQRKHFLIPKLDPGEDHDMGLIQAQPLGTLSANFSAPTGMSPESVTFLDEQHHWIGAIDLVNGKLDDYPMIPGSHLLQVFGSSLSSGIVPILIRSGEHSEVDVALQAGIPCEFSFTFADEHAVPVRLLDLRIFDAVGRALAAEQLGNRDGSFKVRRSISLAPGSYTLRATCSTGVSSTEEFVVPEEAREPLVFDYKLH